MPWMLLPEARDGKLRTSRRVDCDFRIGTVEPIDAVALRGRRGTLLARVKGSSRCSGNIIGIDRGENRVDFGPLVGQRTYRIGGTGVPCQQEGLAAAAAEINFTAVAGFAGGLHPGLAAKSLER